MIPVQDIVTRVSDLLLDADRTDPNTIRWSDAELLRWVNDSRMAILTRRPAACSKVANFTLVAGTQQAIPSDGVQLLDIIRNMGSSGLTPGRAIRRTDRQNIDDHDLNWHAAAQSTEISQFTYDDRSTRVFFVTPPAVAGTQVLGVYASIPTAVASTAENLNIDIENMDAVVNYVCYRAKSKDSQYANAAEAAAYYGAFNDSLGITQQTQASISPNQVGNSV
ncbi:hypothetical protein UFOVP275_28 [uncultured Caudovirales phage]|uniref:Uncharacterized protein n=1 Tax=uncultured Caudovirales phage TaxID=2100421 RepID=A0A6J5LJV3_9CAUD|nr:hypothetical protein UFOVP275_28 [uncultured Caudovirales phage]